MTSLIDVIFLLLLFFMLSSTFSKFAEVEIAAASGGQPSSDEPPVFVQLFPDMIRINGETRPLDDLGIETADVEKTAIIALQPDVDAQRLTDLLVALRAINCLSVTVLGASS